MKQRILILGVTGFLGGALWRFIKEQHPEFDLYGMSRHVKGTNRKIFQCDLNHSRKFKKILTRIQPDYIFNCIGGRLTDNKQLFDANFRATVSLLKTVEQLNHKKPRVIIPGTAAEYGFQNDGRRTIKEDVAPDPASWYGFVKHMQTTISLMYARKELDVVVVRVFNILGEGVSAKLAIGKFSEEIVKIERGLQKPVIPTKNLSGRRDFLDIKDVCSALLLIAQHGKSGQIYNICSGKSLSIRSLLGKLIRYAKVKDIAIQEQRDESSPSFDIVGSNTKMKKVTRWKSRVSIEDSLKETLNYYRGNLNFIKK